ncbi:MAG: hypothetical protein CMJ58_19035 [Planctomycetaceae bacterium]|nr:hypothetical protein [Planctomycetaceae bacterium]
MVDALISIFQGKSQRRLDAIVRQVADLSLEGIAQTVEGRTAGMSLCETRGYIRARATAEVRRQTRNVLERHPGASLDWESEVVARAADRVAPLVLRRLTSAACRKPVVPLAPAAEWRRAA